jgi:type III restriction enzyme
MAKHPKDKSAGTRQTLVQYDQALPEIEGRKAHLPPTSYLEKDGTGGYRVVSGRRPSKLLLVPRIRAEVENWRNDDYDGASDTSKRLLEFWFGTDHRLKDGREFRFYFGQREAIETIIYLHEVKGFRDSADVVIQYLEDSLYGNDLFHTRKQIVEDIQGNRRLQRLVPDTGQVANQMLPPEKLPRYGTKMATGSGKTFVMALAIAWSYFHRRFEADSDLSRHFLILAPNIIVFERLKVDFENEQIFRDLPIIPAEWKNDWDFRTILRGESDPGSSWGTAYLSNIQQLYDRTDDGPINPIDAILGPRVKSDGATKVESIIEMVQKHDDLMVINDEAHHVHDDELEWWKILEKLHKDLVKRTGRGLVAQLDFSATPKDQNGTFFPWIVSDYPLAQAVEDKIVKAPLVVHQTDRKDPDKYVNAAVAYQEWIQIALNRWREHRDAFKKVGVKPVLFVMAENTKDADTIAESIRREADIKENEVLLIHVSERGAGKGEITTSDLPKAREAARSVDRPDNKIKVVVSVLMLREGWDVRNVTVILGLRPFTSDANILPEQAVGRGLRLIRDMPSGYAQIVEIVGTPKFEEFVKELEVEGVGVGSSTTPPPPGVHIFPMKERAEYDIEIPQLSQTYFRNYKDISAFDIAQLPSAVAALDWKPGDPINVVISHGLTEVQLATKSIKFDPDQIFLQDVLAGLTQSIIQTAKLGCQFKDVYPIVQSYVAKRFFGRTVDLENPTVARVLGRHEVGTQFIHVVAEALGKHATQSQQIKLKPEPIRLSDTKAFIWRRRLCDAKNTIFNKVACFNAFEEEFCQFMDHANDVEAFAKLAEWFTGFGLEYLSERGSVRLYYPDFVARVGLESTRTMWIIETKGREDWDTEVPRKDAHAEWWCEQMTKETGVQWRYAKLPYKRFHGKWPSTFASLVESLKPAPGLSLIFEAIDDDRIPEG